MSFLGKMKENAVNPLRLTSLNHVSLLCQSLEESMNFYQKVLGFFPVRRPESLDFEGAWLFGHGIGIHLLGSTEPEKLPKKTAINSKDNHISFQVIFSPLSSLKPETLFRCTEALYSSKCESMAAVEKKLDEMEIEYVREIVEGRGIKVDQIFFHDPDGFMIEICNCDSLPVVPLLGGLAQYCAKVKLHQMGQPQPQTN
nr:unnamed protein product [Brassica oleracea]